MPEWWKQLATFVAIQITYDCSSANPCRLLPSHSSLSLSLSLFIPCSQFASLFSSDSSFSFPAFLSSFFALYSLAFLASHLSISLFLFSSLPAAVLTLNCPQSRLSLNSNILAKSSFYLDIAHHTI